MKPYIDKHNCPFKEKTILQVQREMTYISNDPNRLGSISKGLYFLEVDCFSFGTAVVMFIKISA